MAAKKTSTRQSKKAASAATKRVQDSAKEAASAKSAGTKNKKKKAPAKKTAAKKRAAGASGTGIAALVAELAKRHGHDPDRMSLRDALYDVEKTVTEECKDLLLAIGTEDLQLFRRAGDTMGSWHLYGGDSFEVNSADSIWGAVAPVCIGQSMGSIGSSDILFLDVDGKLGKRGALYVTSFGEGSVILDATSQFPDYSVAEVAPSLAAFLRALGRIPADAPIERDVDAFGGPSQSSSDACRTRHRIRALGRVSAVACGSETSRVTPRRSRRNPRVTGRRASRVARAAARHRPGVGRPGVPSRPRPVVDVGRRVVGRVRRRAVPGRWRRSTAVRRARTRWMYLKPAPPGTRQESRCSSRRPT